MTLPATALPVEAPPAFLGVSHSATGKLWRDRLDARGAARALAIAQRYQLPEMLARVLAGRDVEIEAVEDFLDPTIRKLMPDPYTVTQMEAAAKRIAEAATRGEKVAIFGDYDVDGATSAALLAWHLRHCGLDPLIHIPDRIFEGYGPNSEAIRMLSRVRPPGVRVPTPAVHLPFIARLFGRPSRSDSSDAKGDSLGQRVSQIQQRQTWRRANVCRNRNETMTNRVMVSL